MKCRVPFTLSTPLNPAVKEWSGVITETYRDRSLLDFLEHLVSLNYDEGKIENNTNPYYNIIELFDEDKLYYESLVTFKKYYHFDIIRYLIQNNLAETYVFYPCFCRDDLKKALSIRNNRTDRYTLGEILSNII